MLIKSISNDRLKRMHERFSRLYGPARATQCVERMVTMIGRYGIGYNSPQAASLWSEETAVLITYADTVVRDGETPLTTLNEFAEQRLSEAFSAIHILPFFPWSSDDGFSIIDYRQVNPDVGGWKHVQELGRHFDLMFDLVLNHVSSKSRWFKNYIAHIAPYRDYFIESDPDADLSAVVRPRSLPLLTRFEWNDKEKHLWTTFSEDQIDLNFANPDVLFEFLDILLFYISNGANILRLDAIAYLWKQPGTACIHLRQTHEVVKLMRDLLDMVAPQVLLLTETNVPHEENISYFGDGDEARMVYNFSLPPLLLHALHTGNAEALGKWAETVCETPDGCTWFNFTASHDGIGVRPLTGLVPDEEILALAEKMKHLGGHVSTKRNADGSDSPYELNITYFDALGGDEHQEARFLCSQTVMMALKGVPGVYFHSLTATPNDVDGVEATGRARSINRKRWNAEELDLALHTGGTTSRVFTEMTRRLKLRRRHAAFHPDAAQSVLHLDPAVFAFVRSAQKETVLCISNLSPESRELRLGRDIPICESPRPCIDLLTGARFSGAEKTIVLEPCQTVWLQEG